MKFEYQVRNTFSHNSTVGIQEIMPVEGEILLAQRQWNEGSNILSFSLTLGNPNTEQQPEEKFEESQGTTRDTAITVEIYM